MKYKREVFSKIIREKRTELQLTQAEFGQKVNISGKQISHYEKGTAIPPIETMLRICDIFGWELGYLLGDEDYSDGTKLRTAIKSETGLSDAAINNIQRITGKDRNSLTWGYEYKKYRKVLNALLSSNEFVPFFKALTELDDAVSEHTSAFNDLKDKWGEGRFHAAIGNYKKYMADSDPEQEDDLNDQEREDMFSFGKAIDLQDGISYRIKVCRYELLNSFFRLEQSLYPEIE